MPQKYTTGELAKLCDVSVRTVQFYDTKGILPPTEVSEGGRRLYNENDLLRLRLICMLKALGLNLDSIQGILESEKPARVLNLLLDEQTKFLNNELTKKQEQLEAIKVIKESIRGSDAIPVNSISGIADIMKNEKKLKRVRASYIVLGICLAPFQWGSIFFWIFTGYWVPCAVYHLFAIPLAVFIIKAHYKKIKYICPECSAVFRPRFKNFAFSSGWKVRYLPCTECGYKGLCVEVYASDD